VSFGAITLPNSEVIVSRCKHSSNNKGEQPFQQPAAGSAGHARQKLPGAFTFR
jgi:hypothetical protein